MVEMLYNKFKKFRKVSTDTRNIEPGALFFALKGPNFNANQLAKDALEKGASMVVIDDPEFYIEDERYVLTEDVLTTLQDLALRHRQQLQIPIIALTGSNGKTTTKELIHTVLGSNYKVQATKGNLNNHIGVPLTLLSVTEDHDMAIIEMGANHIGEIAALCRIAMPDHGLITNIGKAHLEGFGGFEGVIRGKSELYQHLISNEGVVWINSQNEILSNMSKRFKKPLFYPAVGDFYHCTLISSHPTLQIKTENEQEITTQLIGAYNFENIAAALCIGKYFDVPVEKSAKAIEEYSPKNNRSQILKIGSNTIIMDAYNANPSSMTSALDNLELSESDSKIVILGDMRELGTESEKEHASIGRKLHSMDLSTVFLYGKDMAAAHKECPESHYFEDKKELMKMIKKLSPQNSLILLKGSRSMKLEEILEIF